MNGDPFIRQRALPGFGTAGQAALERARVAIVGAGGLGCPAAAYLAAAGVGHITLIDADSVSVSNLHRQILFSPDDVGRRKVDAAAEALRTQAPWTTVEPITARLRVEDGAEVIAGHDVVLDCTDTWPSRYDISDVTQELGIPLVWGAVHTWFGQVTVFDGDHRLRDVFPEPPPLDLAVCDAGGVLGPLCGQVATAMASQAIVLLTGTGKGLRGRLSVLDARDGEWRTLPIGGGARA